jgi:hypothetical protein
MPMAKKPYYTPEPVKPDTQEMVSTATIVKNSLKSIIVWWTTADNRRLNLSKMDYNHLLNLRRFLKRHGYWIAEDITVCEISCRLDGHYPDYYNDLCMEYAKNPETWRMEVRFEMENSN